MGSLDMQRSLSLALLVVINLACFTVTASAASFEKAASAKTGDQQETLHRHPGLQMSRDPVEQQHQQQQDLLAAIEGGYQLPPSLEEELEQRLLLSSLLESANNNNLGGWREREGGS